MCIIANREKKLWQRTGFSHALRVFGMDETLRYQAFNERLRKDFGSCTSFRLVKEDLLTNGIIEFHGTPKEITLTDKGKKLQGIIEILEQNLSVQTFCFHFDGYEFGNVHCKLKGKMFPFKCSRECEQFILKEVPG